MSPSLILPSEVYSLLDRFDERWNQLPPPVLEEYLALAAPELRPTLLRELILVDLERRLRRGVAVCIEQYLERFPELAQDETYLAKLIEADIRFRRQKELELTLEEYRQRFPGMAAHLAALVPLNRITVPGGELPGGGADLGVPGYKIERELGRGGMGVVYQARQARPHRIVALKMILVGGHASQEHLQRFKAEAEALARLQHPGIVQVFEVGEYEGLPYFSLEFCPGGSLDRKLAGKPLPVQEAAALVQKLACAVQAAHSAGVIHRDLKPANILLTADGTPKISDFGLARRTDGEGQTGTGAVLGTASYMPPEQARDARNIDARADVYGLGAILYECLAGRPPFRAATWQETIQQVLEEEARPLRSLNPQVSRDLATVCLKCLEKDPKRRYASAGELADDLGRYLSGESVRARPLGLLERSWRWCLRNRFLHVILVVSLGALLFTVLTGIVVGTALGASWLIDLAPADLWIGSGTDGMAFGELSFGEPLPPVWRGRVASQPEVERTESCLVTQARCHWGVSSGTRSSLCWIIGSETVRDSLVLPRSIPYRMAIQLAEPGAVIVAESGLRQSGLEQLKVEFALVNGKQVRVAGVVPDLSSCPIPVVYCSLQTAGLLLPQGSDESKQGNYLLARCRDTEQSTVVVERLRRLHPEIVAFTSEELAMRSRAYWLTGTQAGIALRFAILLVFVVLAVITYQVLSAAIKEYAARQPLDVPRWWKVILVLAQPFWIGAIGFGLMVPVALGVGQLARSRGIWIVLPPWVLIGTAGFTFLVSLIAGLTALRSLKRAQPPSLLPCRPFVELVATNRVNSTGPE